MSFTALTFVNGNTMVAADLRTNLSNARTWLNGGTAAADIGAGTLATRNFRKLDHTNIGVRSGELSSLTATVRSSVGPSGGYWQYSVGSSPADRAYLTPDAQGAAEYVNVPTLGVYFRPDDDGNIDVDTEFWAWAIQSAQTTPENLKQADFRIGINGTTYAPTQRALYDSAHDSTAWQGGQWIYPARNLQMFHSIAVTGGTWYYIRVQAKMTAHAIPNRNNDALIIVGARNILVRYDRK